MEVVDKIATLDVGSNDKPLKPVIMEKVEIVTTSKMEGVTVNMSDVGLYSFIGIFSVVLGIVKELLMIFLLFKGIQVANIYLKKNKDDKDDKDEKDEIK